jgi:hypothetical protein
MRCIRRACVRIADENWRLVSSGGSSSARVSANPATTVSGVRSSCETLATKSRRMSSSWRMRVRSNKASTAPPPDSGRAVRETVRSPSISSTGLSDFSFECRSDCKLQLGVSRQAICRERSAIADAKELSSRLVDSNRLVLRADRDDSFIQ